MLHLFSTLRAVFPTSLAANVTSSNSVLRGSTSSQSMYSKMSKRASWSRWTDFPLLCQKECNPPEEPCHYQCQRSPTSSMNFTSSICIRNFEQTLPDLDCQMKQSTDSVLSELHPLLCVQCRFQTQFHM
jgi:hypothetical protein